VVNNVRTVDGINWWHPIESMLAFIIFHCVIIFSPIINTEWKVLIEQICILNWTSNTLLSCVVPSHNRTCWSNIA
jgi:hypothetical protein